MSAEQPALPSAAHADVDSMLSRKFGKEIANYFSGSPLNRVSFLRADHKFISAALKHPSTRFLLCNDLAPAAKDLHNLYYAKHDDIKSLIGDNPFEKEEAELIKEYRSDVTVPLVLFLGVDEKEHGGFEYKNGIYKGTPYFAVDITPKGTIEKEANGVLDELKKKNLKFLEGRSAMNLNAPEAAIFAQARALLDWNARNPFCGGCGQPTMSVNAGTKRVCPPTDMAKLSNAQGSSVSDTPNERKACVTRKGISNLCFPRTDPTVIMAVVSHDGKRVLLGRQKRWPAHFYSTLAGFCEPAESVEEAVRREVWEESGILLGRVVIHSTQPWPYPANLMIGAVGQALPDGEKVHLEYDPELEDAKWFDLDTIRKALETGVSGLDEGPGKNYKEGDLRLPPRTAIANQLLTAVVGGFLGESPKI